MDVIYKKYVIVNNMDKAKIFFTSVGVLIIAIIVLAIFRTNQPPAGPGELDSFAMCLEEKGTIFYGAFWCPRCNEQKNLFGSSEDLLPYVECSTPDGRGQLADCREKGIEGYPTWEFADASRLSGVISLEALAEKTGCVLPSGEIPQAENEGDSSDAGLGAQE